MLARSQVVDAFGRWGPIAFIVGGIGLLGTTVVGSLDVTGIAEAPPRLAMGPLLFGLWFVFVGLVGLYTHVAEPSSRLSRGGFWTGSIAWVVWTGTLLAALVVDLTSERTVVNPGSWGPPLLTGAFVLALLSFLAYGIAGIRTESPSRTLGVLLLVPVAAFLGQAVLLASKIVTGEVAGALQLALGGIVAVVLIAVGYLLWTDVEVVAGVESQADATV